MSRIVVGRIFWKEMRSQRSLWLGVMLLAIAIQSLIGLLAFHYRNSSPDWEVWAGGIFLAAYIAASLYAIGSGAATFTEESEAKTAWMLRVMPLTRGTSFSAKGPSESPASACCCSCSASRPAFGRPSPGWKFTAGLATRAIL